MTPLDPAVARRIRFVGFDVDGVLTDGGIYLGALGGGRTTQPTRIEFKRYDIQDGLGMFFLSIAGIRTAIVTGRVSESVTLRAKELAIEDVAQNADGYKLAGLQQLLDKRGVAWEDVAFVGDDFPDMPVLRRVGLPVAVSNAVPEVKQLAKVQLQREGGRGAVREFAELLLKARGEWDRTWAKYVDERSTDGPR